VLVYMHITKKILLVEDDPIGAKMVRDFLLFKQYQVVLVNNGNDVIPTIIKEKPDLILMDIQISGISGIEVTEMIKKDKCFKKIPLFIVSAYSKERILSDLNKECFDEIVEKPIIFKDFLSLIAKYLNT